MRPFLIMAGLLSTVLRLLGADSSPTYKTVPIYDDLRAQVLALEAGEFGTAADSGVIAVVMETGYPEAVASLVAVCDGSASLYFSTGGGIIGAGGNERPRAAALKLVAAAVSYLKEMKRSDDTPLPREGFTRFYVVTPTGRLTVEMKEEDLGEGRVSLSPLFHAAHELISEIRRVDEERQKRG